MIEDFKYKATHKMAAFYILYKERVKDPEKYHAPSIVDVGDVYIEEINKWVFTTWKTPTRLTDIYQENDGLLEREEVHSKTGARYYKYRIAQDASRSLIKDEKLLAFYDAIYARK